MASGRTAIAAVPRLASLVAAASLLVAGAATAITGNPPGQLAIHIAVSDSPSFIEEWVSTPFRNAISIHRIREIERGRTAHVALLVTGQSTGRDGRSHVDIAVRVIRPDYSEAYVDTSYAHVSCVESGRVGFTMADPALDFGVDQDDPVGPWLVEAVARDRVTGATALTVRPLVVRSQQTSSR